MSSSGQYQTATVYGGNLWISTNYGMTWTSVATSQGWLGVAMTSSGQYQTTTVIGGNIWISKDYGVTWTSVATSQQWQVVAMTSSGQYQTAIVYGGNIWISKDYGVTWASVATSQQWRGVAMSSSGQYQTALVSGGNIYTSSIATTINKLAINGTTTLNGYLGIGSNVAGYSIPSCKLTILGSYSAGKEGGFCIDASDTTVGTANYCMYLYPFSPSGSIVNYKFAILNGVVTIKDVMTLAATGVSISGTLAVTGATTLTGPTTINNSLEMTGSTRSTGLIISGIQPGIQLNSNTPSGHSWGIWTTYATEDPGLGALAFYDNTAAAFRMTINSSGYVGIGVANASYALDVNGTMRVTGTTTMSNYLTMAGYSSTRPTAPAPPAATIYFPVGGAGLCWGPGYSRIIDDGDLQICTDDSIHFRTGSNTTTLGTEWMLYGGGTITMTGALNVSGATTLSSTLDVNLGIARSGTHAAGKALYVTAQTGDSIIECRHQNGSQGIGIGMCNIFATGSNANQDISINPKGNGSLMIYGIANIYTDERYAVPQNFMAAGSLTIGSITKSYGGSIGGWSNNMASILLETIGSTEIAVHHSGASVRSLLYYANAQIYLGRDMGWGNTNVNIQYLLKLNNGVNTTYPHGAMLSHLYMTNGSSDWYIGEDQGGNNSNLYFASNVNTNNFNSIDICARIENDTAGSTMMNFTGQHRCTYDTTISGDSSQEGLLIVTTGKYWSMIDKFDNTSQIDNITINESLPEISLSTNANCPKVFGVISYTEDINNTRNGGFGRFISIYQNPYGEKKRVFVNALGEGGIWVCNENGSFTNGDLITSSNVPGYGMKQNSNQTMNYTVGKITTDCDFNPIQLPVTTSLKKTEIITETKPMEIEKITETKIEKIIFDEIKQQYIKTNITETKTEKVPVNDEFPLYDENGINIGIHTTQRQEVITTTKTVCDLDENGNPQFVNVLDENGNVVTKPAYQIRYLQSDGKIITLDQYNIMLQNGQNVYIAAFIGCTYQCG